MIWGVNGSRREHNPNEEASREGIHREAADEAGKRLKNNAESITGKSRTQEPKEGPHLLAIALSADLSFGAQCSDFSDNKETKE